MAEGPKTAKLAGLMRMMNDLEELYEMTVSYQLNKVFHCSRNLVANKLEGAWTPENLAADIIGQDKVTMTYEFYSGGTSTRQKFDAVNFICHQVNGNIWVL